MYSFPSYNPGHPRLARCIVELLPSGNRGSSQFLGFRPHLIYIHYHNESLDIGLHTDNTSILLPLSISSK